LVRTTVALPPWPRDEVKVELEVVAPLVPACPELEVDDELLVPERATLIVTEREEVAPLLPTAPLVPGAAESWD